MVIYFDKTLNSEREGKRVQTYLKTNRYKFGVLNFIKKKIQAKSK